MTIIDETQTAHRAVPPSTTSTAAQSTARHAAQPVPQHTDGEPRAAEEKLGFWARRAVRKATETAQADAERAAAQLAAETARAATVTAASRAASRVRAADRAVKTTVRSPDEIAPIPERMQVWGVWLQRTFGTLPLLCPLIVSGWFTAHVFLDPPLELPVVFAILATLALEGGAWRLVRVYERTLIEGDSTLNLRLGIIGYLSLISGAIYGHAWLKAGMTTENMGWQETMPAVICAVLSWLGVYINGRVARFQHRAALRAAEKIDMAMPKFMAASWFITPIDNWLALRHAIKFRISSPVLAVKDMRLYRAAGKPAVWPEEEHTAQHTPEPVPPTAAAQPPARAAARAVVAAAQPVPQPVPPVGAAHGTPTAAAQSPGAGAHPNGTGPVAAPSGAAQPVPQHAAQHAAQHDPVVVDQEALRLADHIMILTEAFPNWRETLPPIRPAIAAIHAARQERDGSSFNSSGTVRKVLAAMKRISESSDPVQAIDQLRNLSEAQLAA